MNAHKLKADVEAKKQKGRLTRSRGRRQKQALTHARKHAHDLSAFAQQVLAFIEELCPNLIIETKATLNGGTPRSGGVKAQRARRRNPRNVTEANR